VRVDGPYGDSGERPAWIKHPVLVIFAGGIGVSYRTILESAIGAQYIHGGNACLHAS